MSTLSQTLLDILERPLPPDDSNGVNNESDDADSVEEYYVCVKCENFEEHDHGEHDHGDEEPFVNQIVEEEDEPVLQEMKSEPVESSEESSGSSECMAIQEIIADAELSGESSGSSEHMINQEANECIEAVVTQETCDITESMAIQEPSIADETVVLSDSFVSKSVGMQTEPSIMSETSAVTSPGDCPSDPIHESESKCNNNDEEENTTALHLPDNSFTAAAFEPMDESRAASRLSQNTGTTGSPYNGFLAAGIASSSTTPLLQYQTPQVKIESRQLLSLFQRSPENLFDELSELLKSAGVEITGGDDPTFVNEMKDVKIKIETPHSIKKEPNGRKRKRSPKFYTPAKRRATKKGAIGSVKTRRTGETKVFKEWDSDEEILSSDSD